METDQHDKTTNPAALTDEMKVHLEGISKWSRFLALTGFIGLGLVCLWSIFRIIMGIASGISDSTNPAGLFKSGMLIALCIFCFSPLRYLYVSARDIKQGLLISDPVSITRGLQGLTSHFKFLSILVLGVMSVYIFSYVVVMAGMAIWGA